MTLNAAQIIGNAVGDEAPEIAPEDLAEETPANEGEESAEPEAEPEPAKPEPSKDAKGLAFFNKELFTDEALSTPEGIAKAAQAIKDRDRFTSTSYVKLKARDKKSRENSERAQRWEQGARLLHERQQGEVELMLNGDANQALEALGRLFRMPGIDAYERFTQTVLANGKKRPTSETEAIKKELADLKNGLQTKEQREAEQRDLHAIAMAESRIAVLAQTEQFPAVAFFAKQSREQLNETVRQVKQLCLDHWNDQVRQGVQRPQPLDHSAALGQLQHLLAPHVPAGSQTGVSPDAGRAPSRNPKPGPTGRTVSPARASTASSRRSLDDMTDEERRADLARDTDALRRFGLA